MVLLWSLVFVFSNFQLDALNIPTTVFEYFSYLCHWPLILTHFILAQEHNITNTEIPFSILPFVMCCRDWRNSFLQHDQNSFAICWTQCHLLRQYKSGLLKFSGGGITTLDLMVNMFDGGSGTSHVGSLIFSVVRGLEFKIPSALVTNVRSDSSSSDFLGQHCTGQNPTQCCLWGSSQQCTGNPVLYRLNTPKGYIVQVKTLCNVVLTTPDNNA